MGWTASLGTASQPPYILLNEDIKSVPRTESQLVMQCTKLCSGKCTVTYKDIIILRRVSKWCVN
jgi:hypothetical protein